MNREILFRGKLLAGSGKGEWTEGCLKIWPDNTMSILPDNTVKGVYGAIDPNTVARYTGLTDKNGVKIFEGDIIKSNIELFVVKYGHCGGVQNVEHEVGYIGFYVEPIGSHANVLLRYGMRTDILYWHNECGFEVIGNIHDNPELLEEVGPNA